MNKYESVLLSKQEETAWLRAKSKKTQEVTTTNLADFCYQERKELIALLTAWNDQGLPDDFSDEGVHAMFNRNSGNVFLTNENFEVAMLNGNKLEIWHNCFNCGHEGFQEDCQLNEDGCNECNPQEEGEENA
jgi:hypothetical protein